MNKKKKSKINNNIKNFILDKIDFFIKNPEKAIITAKAVVKFFSEPKDFF